MRNLSQQERQDAVNEIRLLASVQQNTAISGFHEAFIDGNRLCIVMEYAPFGDLSRALRKRQAQRKLLPEDLIWSYFIQIARGLQALHSQKILHRDVKTANVLRMSGEVVKLGDLGVAKLMKNNMTNTQIGTPHYMPPEVWRNRPYTFNSDVWALGCVLFEMCTFTVPFEARSMEELRFKVMKGKIPALPQVYSGDMQKMVKWLMILEPSQRPNIDAVLDHPSVRRRAHRSRLRRIVGVDHRGPLGRGLDQDAQRAHVAHLRVLREGAARVEAVQRRLAQGHRQVVDVHGRLRSLQFVQPVAGELERAHEQPRLPRQVPVLDVPEEAPSLVGERGGGKDRERRGGEERDAAGGGRDVTG